MLEKIFIQKIQEQEIYIKTHQKTYNNLTHIRLIAGILCLITTYLLIQMQLGLIYCLLALISYGVFIKLIQEHKLIQTGLHKAKGLIEINQRYIKRLRGDWAEFEDKGEEFYKENHPYALDLDIIGEKSLFQMLNTAHTWHGRRTLAHTLLSPQKDEKTIRENQQAIKELSKKLDLVQNIEYITSREEATREDPRVLIAYCNKSNEAFAMPKWILDLLTVITCSSFVIAIILANKYFYFIVGIGATLQYSLIGIYFKRIQTAIYMVRQMCYKIEVYHGILQHLEKETFYAPKLKAIRTCLFEEKYSALKGIQVLTNIADKSQLTSQPLLGFPLNALLLWDLRTLLQLEKWREEYGKRLENWLKAIGELESLMSLSVLHHLNENLTYPLLDTTQMKIEAKALGHPLIRDSKRVSNDLKIEENIWIVTGSNMSGKTTFLRTIGINLVLAYCGAPVIANYMITGIADMYTSMRIQDDLKEGISTFYAELLRIKMMIEAAKKDKPIIFLIDEIFRGTNSIDRVEGAKSVLKSLNQTGIIGAMTTHDLELCELANQHRVKNYHFTEYYKEDKILFDYKLKEGPSTSTNAKYLMKMVGISFENE